MKIDYDANPKGADIQQLKEGIVEYARRQRDHAPMEPFAFFMRDDSGNIMGGCNGNIAYGWIYVDQLWVAETWRGKGYGTQLMKLAEKLGKEKGCIRAAVNTMDWEAPEFYKKLGYYVEFERHGLAKDSIYYYLRKELT